MIRFFASYYASDQRISNVNKSPVMCYICLIVSWCHEKDRRDLRLKLQNKSTQSQLEIEGIRDLREKLSGSNNSLKVTTAAPKRRKIAVDSRLARKVIVQVPVQEAKKVMRTMSKKKTVHEVLYLNMPFIFSDIVYQFRFMSVSRRLLFLTSSSCHIIIWSLDWLQSIQAMKLISVSFVIMTSLSLSLCVSVCLFVLLW